MIPNSISKFLAGKSNLGSVPTEISVFFGGTPMILNSIATPYDSKYDFKAFDGRIQPRIGSNWRFFFRGTPTTPNSISKLTGESNFESVPNGNSIFPEGIPMISNSISKFLTGESNLESVPTGNSVFFGNSNDSKFDFNSYDSKFDFKDSGG